MSLPLSQSSWLVAHVGAREHYATARALHAEGRLACLATDWWKDGVPAFLRRGPLRMVNSRFHPGIPASLVRYPFWLGHLPEHFRFDSRPHNFARWIHAGRRFATWAAKGVEQDRMGKPRGVLGYSGSALELLQAARRKGLATALMQVDPGPLWYDSYREAWQKNPEMEPEPARLCPLFRERLVQEWEAADQIFVNSEHSLQRVAQAGAPASKLRVLPLSFEGAAKGRSPRSLPQGRPFVVLWAGHVSLIKGFAAFFGAAQKLSGKGFRFVCAGTVGLSPDFVRDASGLIEFKGKVPRSAMEALYDEADALAFPTLSDGFGMVQLEAMSRGLPVVATPNCGQVVEEGKNGCVIPAGDAAALSEAICCMAGSSALYAAMSAAALATSSQNGLDCLARRLGDLLP